MRTLIVTLSLFLALLGAAGTATADHHDPLGPLKPEPGEIRIETNCVGPWTMTITVGPVTIVTCDPFMGNPPW